MVKVTLKLTERQAQLLERSLFGVLGALELDSRSGYIHLNEVEGLPQTRNELHMLQRTWWKLAKLVGKA